MADWPQSNLKLKTENLKLIDEMKHVRKIVELGLAARKEAQIKVKQPLSKVTVYPGEKETKFGTELDYLILDELNIKKIEYATGKTESETKVELDTELTEDLIAERQAREILRMIQEERKKAGTELDEKINLSLEEWPEKFEEYIKKNALVENLSKGKFEIARLKS